MPDDGYRPTTPKARGCHAATQAYFYGSVFPNTIKQIQAMGQVTRRVTPTAWVHARALSKHSFGLGPNTRIPTATASGTKPNKIMSTSLNSLSRAGMTIKLTTIQ
jgi:hypothetical protein